MTSQEEHFLHFVQSIQNLNNAWVILQLIKNHERESKLVNSAFQFALIEYSKPYKHSRGETKSHKLDTEHVPSKHKELHGRIIDARDQIHAHSDLTVMDAKVYVKNTPYRKIAGHVQNVIRGTEEFSNLDSIIDLIEGTLDSMYKEEKNLQQLLPEKVTRGRA